MLTYANELKKRKPLTLAFVFHIRSSDANKDDFSDYPRLRSDYRSDHYWGENRKKLWEYEGINVWTIMIHVVKVRGRNVDFPRCQASPYARRISPKLESVINYIADYFWFSRRIEFDLLGEVFRFFTQVPKLSGVWQIIMFTLFPIPDFRIFHFAPHRKSEKSEIVGQISWDGTYRKPILTSVKSDFSSKRTYIRSHIKQK